MDRVTKVTAFKTADGKLHETAVSARVSVLQQLVSEAAAEAGLEGGALYREDVEKFFMDNFDKLGKKLDQIMGSIRS